jgi:hypothetical protein
LSHEGASAAGTKILELLEAFPKEPLDFFDRTLSNLGRLTNHPTGTFTVERDITSLCFCHTVREAFEMLRQLESERWIAPTEPGSGKHSALIVTPEGWRRIEKLRKPGRDSRQAFVAMWFNPDRVRVFDDGFKPAIEADERTKAFRVDRKEHNQKIDDEIVAEIRRSRYLVADFTGNRGGVYFEAGFALGLGLPVIWCVEQGQEKDLHFDTRQFNHVTYADPADLKAKLVNRIRATIV